MKIVEQSYQIEWMTEQPYLAIERIGRTCYKSEDKITADSAIKFVEMLVKRGHLAMIEHASLSVRFVTDRGVSHELVRHRIASFAQESTRYVNYGNAGECTFVRPIWHGQSDAPDALWLIACQDSESSYLRLLQLGQTPQQARQVLNNSTKTEIIITANFREWRHFLKLRAVEKAAHPQMRALTIPLYQELRRNMPEIFDMGEVEQCQ
jgi:thymidylate synthase (FAD)